MKNELIDSPAREQFAGELNQSFSVIAPAGVGKTTAIIERLARLLKQTSRRVALVTYTQRAAREMHEKLLAKVGPMGADPQRLYVGTIHGLCVQILRANPQHFGLGGAFEVTNFESRLWSEFLEECPMPLEVPQAERFCKYFASQKGWREIFFKQLAPVWGPSEDPPTPDYKKIEALVPPDGRTRTAIESLKRWARERQSLSPDALWAHPKLPSSSSEKVAALFEEVLAPYRVWRSREGLRAAAAISQKFRAWRLARGKLTYDDLIAQVYENLKTSLGFSVILDEAQDTSLTQLELLQRAARRDENGRLDFCMVGDPQQSIYSSRAKLKDYLAAHERLIREEGLKELTFRVTFRCPQQVVTFVNAHGGDFLDGMAGQAKFVELISKPEAIAGGVEKLTLIAPRGASSAVEAATACAAEALVERLKTFPSEDLHKVAVLAPRRRWLEMVLQACQRAGIPAQFHAQTVVPSAALGLAKSLLHLMSYPDDSFELVGLLREISTVGDRDLACAVREIPQAFSLAREEVRVSNPELDKKLACLKQAWKSARSLPAAQAFLCFAGAAGVREVLLRSGAGALAEWDELLEALLPTLKLPMAENIEGLAELLKERHVRPGCLQLLTMHKAKGLEWDVVILPFLRRTVGERPPQYPRWVESPEGAQLLFGKDDPVPEGLAPLRAQELARLFYVSLTRARRQLILVDDADCFPEVAQGSLIKLLHEPATMLFSRLPEAQTLQTVHETVPVVTCTAPLEAHARAPWRVVVPSALVQHPEELTEEQRLGEGGARYGNWWHDLWPVSGFPNSPEALLSAAEKSPYPERAHREMEVFAAHPLYAHLAACRCQFEKNFLARVGDHAIEGRLDLLAEEPDGGVLIVDWKTDQIPLESLVDTYRAQLEAYREGLESLLQKKVRATLYSSFHGVWMESSGVVLRS